MPCFRITLPGDPTDSVKPDVRREFPGSTAWYFSPCDGALISHALWRWRWRARRLEDNGGFHGIAIRARFWRGGGRGICEAENGLDTSPG